MAHQTVSARNGTRDEWRSARLLFAPELASGALDYSELARPEVLSALRSRPLPSAPRRLSQRLAQRRGRLDAQAETVAAFMHARRAVLGEAAYGRPRVLVRVDEFPHCRAADEPELHGTAAYARFHELLHEAGVDYLVAVLPMVARDPYDPAGRDSRPLDAGELEQLALLRSDGVEFATHGFDHRTRESSARRRSELSGLSAAELTSLLDRSTARLADVGIAPRVFVPPFNRFDAGQYPLLARRYDVVCGGPESIASMGFQRGPLWRDDAVYFPSYAPLYGRAEDVVGELERLAALEAPVWAQVTLHWGWERKDDFRGLARSVERLAAFTRPWSELLVEIDTSRDAVAQPSTTRLLASPARRRPGYAARGRHVA